MLLVQGAAMSCTPIHLEVGSISFQPSDMDSVDQNVVATPKSAKMERSRADQGLPRDRGKWGWSFDSSVHKGRYDRKKRTLLLFPNIAAWADTHITVGSTWSSLPFCHQDSARGQVQLISLHLGVDYGLQEASDSSRTCWYD